MTRQNSRPPKKKHRKVNHFASAQPSVTMTLEVVIASPFKPSLALEAQLLEKRHSSIEKNPKWRPKPGSIFSTGQCIAGTKRGRDNYTVRIKNRGAARSILDLSPGTRIRLNDAKFINSYGSKKYREISASSYELITEQPRMWTSATPSIRWAIYPTEFGVKQKKGVTLHKPMMLVTVSSSS